MKKEFTARQTAEYGILIALAMILSYVEYLLPFLPAVPGVKLGLANIVIVFSLYRLGGVSAAVISLIRILLMALLFGNGFALFYSLTGAILSLSVMLILKKIGRFSPVGVGAAGGVSHNIGQLLCAIALLGVNQFIFYLPVLLVSGTVAGILIGVVADILLKRLGVHQCR